MNMKLSLLKENELIKYQLNKLAAEIEHSFEQLRMEHHEVPTRLIWRNE